MSSAVCGSFIEALRSIEIALEQLGASFETAAKPVLEKAGPEAASSEGMKELAGAGE